MSFPRNLRSCAALALLASCASAVTPAAREGGSGDAADARTTPSCPAGMTLIPAGMFEMGDPMSDDAAAQPVHGVRLSTYCMDVTEVTVVAYRACTASGCTAPVTGGACNWGVAGRDLHPLNCVDWNQARAYCQFRGGDLPTEAQWEYAARGPEGRMYPWGSDAPASQLCWSLGTRRSSTCPVGSFPAGASPFGLLDMAGNVYEWDADWHEAYTGSPDDFVTDPVHPTPGEYGHYCMRGGGWHDVVDVDERATVRSSAIPTFVSDDLGFRCVHAPM